MRPLARNVQGWTSTQRRPRREAGAVVLRASGRRVDAGAHGMTAGRNIWQATDPGKMVVALKAVIHGGDSPEVAAKILD